MSVEENKAIVRRFVEEVQSRHNLDAMNGFFSDDFVDHAGMSAPTVEGAKQLFASLFEAFPDLEATIHDQIAEGDKVVTRKTLHGTHQGEFQGIAPTGKKVTRDVIDIFRIEGGKFKEHWAIADQLGFLQQLGAISLLGQKESK